MLDYYYAPNPIRGPIIRGGLTDSSLIFHEYTVEIESRMFYMQSPTFQDYTRAFPKLEKEMGD